MVFFDCGEGGTRFWRGVEVVQRKNVASVAGHVGGGGDRHLCR